MVLRQRARRDPHPQYAIMSPGKVSPLYAITCDGAGRVQFAMPWRRFWYGKSLPGMANAMASCAGASWPRTRVKCYKGSTNPCFPLVEWLRIRKGRAPKRLLEWREELASTNA